MGLYCDINIALLYPFFLYYLPLSFPIPPFSLTLFFTHFSSLCLQSLFNYPFFFPLSRCLFLHPLPFFSFLSSPPFPPSFFPFPFLPRLFRFPPSFFPFLSSPPFSPFRSRFPFSVSFLPYIFLYFYLSLPLGSPFLYPTSCLPFLYPFLFLLFFTYFSPFSILVSFVPFYLPIPFSFLFFPSIFPFPFPFFFSP